MCVKVDIAARHGAVGIIIYSDPKDYTWPEEDSRVFPDTIWLPPTAAQRGTIYTGDGDPLTPGYPATGQSAPWERLLGRGRNSSPSKRLQF